MNFRTIMLADLIRERICARTAGAGPALFREVTNAAG
jgi:hypothetical protein